MSAAKIIQVAHPFAHFAKGWGIARSAIVFLCLATFASGVSKAQSAPCGLTSMKDSTPLFYPPIARYAHVQGLVISIVRFSPSGSVDNMAFLSGPEMLRAAASEYINGLKANEYSGLRECPMVIDFSLISSAACENVDDPAVPFHRTDLQHVSIRRTAVSLCHPNFQMKQHKRFLIF
jgi:hypothetical protein